GPAPEDLRQVRVRKDVDEAGGREARDRRPVAPPHVVDRVRRPDPGLGVDGEPVEPVHRAEQVVPRVRLQDLGELGLPRPDPVDLEPELDRQPLPLRLDDRRDVVVEVVDAALRLVRQRPESPRLPEVVDVLREAELVDAAAAAGLDVALDRGHGVVDRLLVLRRPPRVQVVVDDHADSHSSISARSAAVVTFSRRGSPSTTAILPPWRSTREAQSDASASSATAARSGPATNACGVCTATSPARGSVSTTTPPCTRFTVSTSGRPGTAPSQPSPSAVSSRSTTASSRSGRAASWTRIAAALAPTSATPAATDS